ncbi:MAG: TaqI-like C-terminal specificity domain-containing protein [Victivallaceae bacterium]|nr:TaqI-like C-terminal specificity domain-containing protein [Victivallaceae bacterium]
MDKEAQTIGTTEAAAKLGVSEATIRNWVRAGLLHAASPRPLGVNADEVSNLGQKLQSGTLDRLKQRANKSMSAADAPLPRECVSPATSRLLLRLADRWKQCGSASPDDAMHTAFLQILSDCGELKRDGSCRRRTVAKIISNWDMQWHRAGIFSNFTIAPEIPALLYQTMLGSGGKARHGVFYTPPRLAEETVANLRGTGELLDPCCGGGAFLLAARRKLHLAPQQLYGIDCDPAAVEATRLALLIDSPQYDEMPRIITADALTTSNFDHRFEAIAVNPPWNGGIFSEFIAAALDRWLASDGRAAFLLPEAITNIRAHAAIRRRILNEASLEKLVPLGRRWSGVLSGAVQLVFQNTPCTQPDTRQKRFSANRDARFDLRVSAADAKLLHKIFAVPHRTLAGHAHWALGIVTGNNAQTVLDAAVPDSEPILRGPDIKPFIIGQPTRRIVFDPAKLQQCAPQKLYRAPGKLLYRFISKRLIFAFDDQQRLHLNSVNALLPELSGLSDRAVMAVLNSSVFQYIHQKCHATCKVLRRDLEELPFPLDLPDEPLAQVHSIDEADALVFKAFHLNKADIAHIKRELAR